MQESAVDIQTVDGLMETFIVRPDGGGPFPIVILYMDFVGIRVGIVGCCMSGRYVFYASGTLPDCVVVSASVYGDRLITDQPDSAYLSASKIKGEMYFARAEHDIYASSETSKGAPVHSEQGQGQFAYRSLSGSRARLCIPVATAVSQGQR